MKYAPATDRPAHHDPRPLAEKISGQQLDGLFQTWLFTTTKPVLDSAAATPRLATATEPPAAALSLLERHKAGRR